ncbi:P-loop NTPase fold protein [Pseudoalteromonas sp. SCSIO 43101]|uniref:KAP family P-loop NTPase fold protein n=1 Tax=Pseudoalteromonas sp. SCSIO 43101 TaxID=2822847 RepID=UPI0015B9296A|nr:P-loop NTPase fold protein [Pseudoalteromonas sp. SCSIO 43101]QLE09166.1 NTPase KAP [Pseudoalteromonas shioyasakiensis]URQ91781.1 hypothetical protein J8Z25_07530 [Pseudoalteromonas sp. SCSIO 43101]
MTSNSQSLITSCKYKEWLDKYTFENCKLNRGEYGEFLASYITGEHDGFVLNLNGAWGTGKTQFLKRFYSELCSKGHPTIYIDAWESDFSEIPLSVVASELINQLSKINEDIGNEFDKVQHFLGKALKGTVVAGAGLLTKHLLGEASVGTEVTKALFEKEDQDYLKAVMDNHVEQIDAIKDIRDQLAQLGEVLKQNFSYELPVIVLIDELDRCRPSYAIEMLEVIKHFFTTKNFVFVVATDSEQLQHSIKAIYGSDFDSTIYLKRFFDREASLDKPNLAMYLGMQDLKSAYDCEGVHLYPIVVNHLSDNGLNDYICWIAQIYDLSLRDLDQLVAKLKACLRYASSEFQQTNGIQYINIFTLLLVLAEMDTKKYVFGHNDGTYPEIVTNMQNMQIGNPSYADNPTKFNNFASLMVHCSKMHDITLNNSHVREHRTTVIGAHNHFTNRATSAGTMSEVAFYEIANIYRKHREEAKRSSTSRFWLWSDYIKISKLAGRLD